MNYYNRYRWCVLSSCNNTSVKTPEKLFIKVPDNTEMRNVWLELAKRDPKSLSPKSRLYLCGDHFNLEKDMENYREYQIMGSVKQVKMKPNTVPFRLYCTSEREGMLSPSSQSILRKIQAQNIDEENVNNKIVEDFMDESGTMICVYLPTEGDTGHFEPSATQLVYVQISETEQYKVDKPTRVQTLSRECKSVQANITAHYRSKYTQVKVNKRDRCLSPIISTVSIETSPHMKGSQMDKPSTSGVTRFPDDPELRSAWIAATKRINWVPKNSSRICGRHFKVQLSRKKGKTTVLYPNAVPNMDYQAPVFVRDVAFSANGEETLAPQEEKPSLPLFSDNVNNEQNQEHDVQMCRICFATGDNLHSMKTDTKLDHAYETLTGLSIQNDDDLPCYLCVECSQQLLQCICFRDRSLRAHLLLLDILRRNDCITLDLIKSVTECHDVNLNVNSAHIPDEYDLKTVDDIKMETDEHLCDRNDPNSNEEDLDIKDIDIKKEVDCTFSDGNHMHEDTVDSSRLDEGTLLSNIKVEIEDADEEKSTNDGDATSNDMLYSDTSESDVGLDYTPEGPTKRTAEVSNAEVKATKKTPKKLRQKSTAKLLVYDNLFCHVCPYKTASDVKLLRHLKTHDPCKLVNDDSNENIYSCMLCEKTFNMKWGLVKHLKIHSSDKPYPCNECDKSFKENRDLQNHLRTHSGEKPFVCDLCQRSFSERGNLLRHIRIHAGQKPYICKYCKISFSQKHHLKRHLTRHC